MGRVADKVAIVTGGSKGLGKATAKLLVDEGAAVVITDIDEASGAAAAKEMDSSGARAAFMPQDVTDPASWDAVIEATRAQFGPVSVLVNNAGVATFRNVEDETLEEWRKLLAVNLDAVFLGTQAAIKAMKSTGGGSIINLSSIEGIVGDAMLPSYNASKGGVRVFTKSAALHCAKAGYEIRVNSVHPGYIWTPMVEAVAAEAGPVEEAREAFAALHPIGRLGRPEEIAYPILFLASDESSFMTGSELVVDGGYTAQ